MLTEALFSQVLVRLLRTLKFVSLNLLSLKTHFIRNCVKVLGLQQKAYYTYCGLEITEIGNDSLLLSLQQG